MFFFLFTCTFFSCLASLFLSTYLLVVLFVEKHFDDLFMNNSQKKRLNEKQQAQSKRTDCISKNPNLNESFFVKHNLEKHNLLVLTFPWTSF